MDAIRPWISEDIARAMEEIHICQHCGKDRMAWPHCLSGQYTVKEGYHLLKKKEEGNRIKKPSSSHCVDEKLWKIIWCLKTLPKVKMFLWRACRNLLVTNQNLCKKKIKDDPMCIVCGNEIESVEHILSTCEGVRNVWFGLNFCFRINKVLITTMDEWLVGIEGLVSKENTQQLLMKVAFTCWHIWKARCKLIFQNESWNPGQIIWAVNAAVRELDTIKLPGIKMKEKSKQMECSN